MKLQNQVCSLQQAKKLKELGICQNSHFSWCGDETQRLMDNGKDGIAVSNWVFLSETLPVNNQEEDHRRLVPSAKPFAAAFTVAELGVMLPDAFESISAKELHGTVWYGIDQNGNFFPFKKQYQTEAECRAEMIIELIESGQLAIIEVNQSLTNS